MYILKNAWRSISRAKVRNILIGVIVLVIATSSCVALSIREASGTAKEQYLEDMEVTAQISLDRQSMMQGFSSIGGGRGGQMSGQKPGRMGMQGDATIVGYSSDSAMTGFVAGTSTITDGQMFEENTQAYDCVISDELATYNELQVGDTIAVVNPNNEEESYTLTIVGLYNNQESGMSQTGMMGGFSTATDSANQIYMSYDALSLILEASEATAEATKQEDDETEVSALVNQLSGTYTFATVEDYETFEEEARALGLSDDYTISSGDL